MSKLFKTPKPQQEDPEVTRLRNQEQARAEADRLKATQAQLGIETTLRNRTSGLRSLLGPLAGGNRIRSLLGAG